MKDVDIVLAELNVNRILDRIGQLQRDLAMAQEQERTARADLAKLRQQQRQQVVQS